MHLRRQCEDNVKDFAKLKSLRNRKQNNELLGWDGGSAREYINALVRTERAMRQQAVRESIASEGERGRWPARRTSRALTLTERASVRNRESTIAAAVEKFFDRLNRIE